MARFRDGRDPRIRRRVPFSVQLCRNAVGANAVPIDPVLFSLDVANTQFTAVSGYDAFANDRVRILTGLPWAPDLRLATVELVSTLAAMQLDVVTTIDKEQDRQRTDDHGERRAAH